MTTTTVESSGGIDLLGYVTETVRQAIEAGLIKTTSLDEFEQEVELREGNDLEDYLQDLWDNI